MGERPIIFSAPMVRAILDGRKTQTRRVVKYIPVLGEPEEWCHRTAEAEFVRIVGDFRRFCPYGVPGDRLWVRESHWRFTGCAPTWEGFVVSPDGDPYQARCYDDYPNLQGMKEACAGVRVPSIHMPRWASRITLEVTGVRVERLQEISFADAVAEGLEEQSGGAMRAQCWGLPEWRDTGRSRFSAIDAYQAIWEEINGAGSWGANPWVWVIEFAATPKGGA